MATSVLNQLTSMPKLPITSGLMETTKKSPKGYLGGAEVGPALEELRGAESAAEKKVGEADVAIEEAKRQEKGREAEQKMQLAERMGKEAREMPERKALGEARQELQEMAFVPTKETAQDLAALFSLVSVIGMVAGKGNSQLAMSAMNGMLEGHQKGRTDLYKQQQIEFDKNFKAMQAKIGTLEKELDEAMKLKTYDKEAGEQAINLALAKSESPLLKAMKDKQGDVAVLNAVRGSKKDLETVVNIQNKLQSEADARQARKEAQAAQNQLRRDLAAQRVSGAAKPSKDYSSVSELVQDKTGARLKDKDAEQVAIAANAIGDAAAIKQIVKEHPEWVGRSGQIKNIFNRTVESINLGTPMPDDQGQPELIFAKRYAEYLANYERALAGGARGFTVYFQRRFNQLLEQNQFNAAGMENLMDEQMRTITSQVASKGKEITRDTLSNLARDIKQRAGDEEAIKGLGMTPQVAKPTQEQRQNFESVEDAEKANLPKGAKITIKGRPATVE